MAAPDRRQLRFETINEALAEADRLVAAEREGRLTRLGNWTVGQALGHLATWINFAFESYPPQVQAPLPVRLILRLFRGPILRKGMMAGVRVGRIPEGTVGLDLLEPQEGLARFRAAMERLASTAPTIKSPVFGKMSHAQWIALNLRHAELHMSFLIPEAAPAQMA